MRGIRVHSVVCGGSDRFASGLASLLQGRQNVILHLPPGSHIRPSANSLPAISSQRRNDARKNPFGSSSMDDPLDELLNCIRADSFKRVVIVSGAGVSTDCGVPDFRSPGGIFDVIRSSLGQEYPSLRANPELLYTASWRHSHPHAVERASRIPELTRFRAPDPGPSHRLAAHLARRGFLARVYTQNVDGLYQRAGVPPELLMECHGNMDRGDLVWYGEQLPQRMNILLEKDFPPNLPRETPPSALPCDLLLVMGTALQVAPFCAIPNLAHPQTTRALVTLDTPTATTNPWSVHAKGLSQPRLASDVKIGGRRVTLRAQWDSRMRWRRQFVLDMTCEQFAVQMAIAMGLGDVTQQTRFVPHTHLSPCDEYCTTLECMEITRERCLQCEAAVCTKCSSGHSCDF